MIGERSRRTTPDPEMESRILSDLARHLANSPENIFIEIAKSAVEMCGADAACVFLLEQGSEADSVSCVAQAGPGATELAGALPTDLETLLAKSTFTQAMQSRFLVGGQVAGAIWIAASEQEPRFSTEEQRILESLGHFAAAARRLGAEQERSKAESLLQEMNALLEERVREKTDALVEANAKYQAMFDQGLFAGLMTTDGTLIDANRSSLDTCGFTEEEVIGKPFWETGWWNRSPEVQAWLMAGFAQAVQGHVFRGETPYFVANGEQRIVDFAFMPIKDEDGEVRYVVPTGMDITDRRIAEQERKTLDVLQESDLRFRQMADNAPVLIWISGPDKKCIWFNKPWLDFVGRSLEQELGDGWAENVHPDDLERCVKTYETCFDLRQPFAMDYRLRRHDGEYCWVLDNGVPFLNSAGEFMGYIGSCMDISEQKTVEAELRESEARFRSLADHAPVLIWVNGIRGCEFVNREYLRFLGRSFEEVRWMNWKDFLHPEDADDYLLTYQQAFENRAPFEAQTRFRRADGQYRWIRSSATPRFTPDRMFLGYVGCSMDITDIKKSGDALKEADRRKDEFLATLAHELRNPLAPIRNSLHILRIAGNGSAAARVLDMMDRQVNQMVRLVEDLLEVSRITRGKIELRRERVELSTIVRAAIETSKPLIEAARHELIVLLPSESLLIEGDQARLAQVFANLMNNAAKYTEEGGRIWVSAMANGPDVTVSVRDNGMGIPETMVPKVFDLFTQVDRSGRRSQGGLGIGLTLVKRLVAMHGGTVQAKSDGPGCGSEFLVTLPLAEPGYLEEEQNGLPPEASAAARKRRVLVVDDNRDAADSLGILLRFAGVEVHVAHDGSAALEAMRAFQPEIVILDLGMPGMDGYDVARRIRQQGKYEDVVLIALTGWGQPEDRKRSNEAGFDHHLVKPVELDALQALLTSLETADS
jgi:PAS domain S-box-containing protein